MFWLDALAILMKMKIATCIKDSLSLILYLHEVVASNVLEHL